MPDEQLERSTVRRLAVAAAPAAAELFVFAGSVSAGSHSDEVDDSGAAPDITGVVVVNAGGQLTFTLQIPTFFLRAPAQVQLFIDPDANPATGRLEYAGADYILVSDQSDHTWRNADTAPDVGLWNYDLRADGPDIRGIVTTTKPAAGPKSGKPFTVAVTGVNLPPDGEPNADDPAAGQVPLHRDARRPEGQGPQHRRLHVHPPEERAREAARGHRHGRVRRRDEVVQAPISGHVTRRILTRNEDRIACLGGTGRPEQRTDWTAIRSFIQVLTRMEPDSDLPQARHSRAELAARFGSGGSPWAEEQPK